MDSASGFLARKPPHCSLISWYPDHHFLYQDHHRVDLDFNFILREYNRLAEKAHFMPVNFRGKCSKWELDQQAL